MPAPDTPDRSKLIRTQYAFTAHIRDPGGHPCPKDIPERRMRVYRELLYNNIESSLLGCFPVTRKILPQENWAAMVQDFFARHKCHRHAYREIPREFIDYLMDERTDPRNDPPFLHELMHYEWVELALAVSDIEIDMTGIDRGGDLLAGIPALSPLAWPLSYTFPVHKIDIGHQPQTPGTEPTNLLIYRDRQDAIGFMELNAVTARLLALLQDNQLSGRQAMQRIAEEIGHPNPQVVIDGGKIILDELHRRDVVLGTRIL